MSKVKSPAKSSDPLFLNDIKEDGYHVYSIKNSRIPGYYPIKLPDYPGAYIRDLKRDDVITLKVFFARGVGEDLRLEARYLDLEVVSVDENSVMAVILTVLPESFPLAAGHSIEVYEEEILYRTHPTVH